MGTRHVFLGLPWLTAAGLLIACEPATPAGGADLQEVTTLAYVAIRERAPEWSDDQHVFCISDAREAELADPAPGIMAELRERIGNVTAGSACELEESSSGVVETGTGLAATRLMLHQLDLTRDEAVVLVRWYLDGNTQETYECALRREASGWMISSCELDQIS